MKFTTHLTRTLFGLVVAVAAFPLLAADHPAPKEGAWIVRDFRFHTGKCCPNCG